MNSVLYNVIWTLQLLQATELASGGANEKEAIIVNRWGKTQDKARRVLKIDHKITKHSTACTETYAAESQVFADWLAVICKLLYWARSINQSVILFNVA